MTVTTFLNYKEYQGDGIATTFTIPFLLMNKEDLQVFIDNKLLLSGYTLTGIGSPISSITFIEAPTGRVLLQRSLDLLRGTDYQENGDLLADTLNRDFDRIYLALQGASQDNTKSLRVVDPEGIDPLPLREIRANKLLAFDSQGQPSLSTVDSGSALALAGSLADTSEKQKGAGLVGFKDDIEYPKNTVGYALKNTTPLFSVQWWADRNHIPSGYFPADGQELSSLVYPDVAKALLQGQMPQVTNDLWLNDPSKRGCYVADTGSGTFRLPDYNGMQPSSIGSLFVRGGNGQINDGKVQGDAIRNITGSTVVRFVPTAGTNTGAFINGTAISQSWVGVTNVVANGVNLTFNASLVVPTAEENRPVNVTGCWIIKLYGGISNTSDLDTSKLAQTYSELSTRISGLEATQQEERFAIIYPNGGAADKPAPISIGSRYIMDNPFGEHHISCRAEVYINDLWGTSPWQSGDNAFSRGALANPLTSNDGTTDKIILQTATTGVAGWSANSGSPHGLTINYTTAPARILVWRID